jgi:hypothetical protein
VERLFTFGQAFVLNANFTDTLPCEKSGKSEISIGQKNIRGLLRHAEAIEERRRLHPYPHELCFCLPSDIAYEKAGIVLHLLATMRHGDPGVFLNFGRKICAVAFTGKTG